MTSFGAGRPVGGGQIGVGGPLGRRENRAEGAQLRRRSRSVPDRIAMVYVPSSVVEATSEVMRRFGHERRECYVWWGGYFSGEESAQVLTAICPEVSTEYGRIQLSREQIGSLQRELIEVDQALIVELHTHPPGAGGQNEVDAAHAAAPYPGFLSIVVPDFGFVDLADLPRCHVYEYVRNNRWITLDPEEIRGRFLIDDAARRVRLDGQ